LREQNEVIDKMQKDSAQLLTQLKDMSANEQKNAQYVTGLEREMRAMKEECDRMRSNSN
jgi:hypothetical protein